MSSPIAARSEYHMTAERLVVVVDDEPDLRSLICEVLQEEGYSVVSLPHPSQALQLQEMPALFLIDLMLPGMTGIELAQELRQGPFAGVGMIGLSASSAMLHHANDSRLFQETIQKPFDLEYLLEAVRQWMTVDDTTLTVVRSLTVSRDAIWRAWTSADELARWWWPERFHTVCEVDLRENGEYRFHTADVPGMGRLAVTGRFETVTPRKLLVYTWCWEGSSDPETRVTVEFLDGSEGTELRIRHEGLPSVAERENHNTGWNDCLDRLEQYARSELEPRGRGVRGA